MNYTEKDIDMLKEVIFNLYNYIVKINESFKIEDPQEQIKYLTELSETLEKNSDFTNAIDTIMYEYYKKIYNKEVKETVANAELINNITNNSINCKNKDTSSEDVLKRLENVTKYDVQTASKYLDSYHL